MAMSRIPKPAIISGWNERKSCVLPFTRTLRKEKFFLRPPQISFLPNTHVRLLFIQGDSESVNEHEEKNPQEDGLDNVEQYGTIPEGFEENVFQSPDEEEPYERQYMTETQQGDLPEIPRNMASPETTSHRAS
ncbi:zinc finger protein 697 isoform X4 [Pelodiscus sinensis]|uniref:zinc finger protein 697 isoform X4 n=2 Tax=Pelodiscus sinensis TaxID=13735 RepID=UPI003F6BDE4E